MSETDFQTLTPTRAKEAGIRRAPWSPVEVVALRARQANRSFHPYTCADKHESPPDARPDAARILNPTGDGWRCRSCDYVQDWAHEADTLPAPGLLFSHPEISHRVYDAATLTPYALLGRIASTFYLRAETFRLVLPRTRHAMRRLPWLDGSNVAYGVEDGEAEEGRVYRYNVRQVREYIAAAWSKGKEEAAVLERLPVRAEKETRFDLEAETKRIKHFANGRGLQAFASSPVMTGTDRRLVANARRQLYRNFNRYAPYRGDALDMRYLTPRLLLEALTGDGTGDLPLPDLITFGPPDVPQAFPWFPLPGRTTGYHAAPFPARLLGTGRLAGLSEFRTLPVVHFLEREFRDDAERTARAGLLETLNTPDGIKYLIDAELMSKGYPERIQGATGTPQ